MILVGDKLKYYQCTGCLSCYNICPTKAINIKEGQDTFLYPVIHQDTCIDCEACVGVCAAIEEKYFERIETPICYAAWHKNPDIVEESSSGGIFSAFAEEVIVSGGYVYGAAWRDDFQLQHIEVDSLDCIKELKASKYIQSNISNVFRQVKMRLQEKKMVLFTGTPCQVAGLNTFLKKDYENLLTCDFVCHGVPSQPIFNRYVKYKELLKGSKFSTYIFRGKKEGWTNYNIQILYKNNKLEEIPFPEDLYMKGFLSDLYLRPSCYQCTYSRIPRVADISIADYWGVWNIFPDTYNKRGVSAVVLNSEKGIERFGKLTSVVSMETNLSNIIKGNPSIHSSVKPHKKRALFYKLYAKEESFDKIIEKCLPKPSYIGRVKWSLNKRINKYFKRNA